MPQALKVYLVALVAFLILDAIWLGLVARGFYIKRLGPLMLEQPNWSAAVAFYLLFIGGVVYFCILPSLQEGSLGRALLNGALFGLMTYATYDLTNLATLKGWPPMVTAVDLCWGAALTASVSTIGYAAGRWFS